MKYSKIGSTDTAQEMKFSIKDFFSKSNQLSSFLRIWSNLPKKSLMENFIFLCSGGSFLYICVVGNTL